MENTDRILITFHEGNQHIGSATSNKSGVAWRRGGARKLDNGPGCQEALGGQPVA